VTKRWLAGLGARDLTVVRFGLAGLVTLPLLLANPPAWPPPAFWSWIAWLVPLELLALVLYVQAIRDHPLSLTLPYLAFTPAFITLTGWLVLGEHVSLGGFIGIALVVGGSWLLHLEGRAAASWRRALTAPLSHPGSRRMLAVAFIYALTSVGGKGAMQYMEADQFGPLYIFLVGTGAMLLFRGWERLPRVIGLHPFAATAAATLMGAMVLTHFLALQQVETAYMIALKRTSLLFGIVFGFVWFGERRLRGKLLAGSLMLAGVAVITAT
jgi:drug/metabolite transporter (DMT)-like permease